MWSGLQLLLTRVAAEGKEVYLMHVLDVAVAVVRGSDVG